VFISSNTPLQTAHHKQGDKEIGKMGINMTWGAVLISLWLAVLIVVLVLVRSLDYDHRREATPLDWFETFYRTGSIIYGGGQV
jgi:chromate transporter